MQFMPRPSISTALVTPSRRCSGYRLRTSASGKRSPND